MDDFIRPEQQSKQLQQPRRKKSHFKDVIIILTIIISLGLGFIAGYFSKDGTGVVENSKDDSVLKEAYTIISENWFNASEEDINIASKAIEGLVNGLGDIHTSYLTSDQSVEFNQSVNGNYEGIGVSFSVVKQGALVVKVFDGSPAQASNIQVGDIFLEANGESLEDKDSEEIKNLVRGEPGTIVTLTILRESQEITIDVTRNALSTAVAYGVREANGKKFGYIEITTFGNTTALEVEAALKEFKEQAIETLVLDLRDNGGGYLNAAVNILELFFKDGEVIYKMQEKNGPIQETKAKNDDMYTFTNGYILVNGNSASASELVAGALQEERGYQLVGTQTYGKGTAQTQAPLSDGSVLKYTYAKWMTPSGFCVNGEGLTPDIKIENHNISDITIDEVVSPLQFDQVDMKVVSMQKMLGIIGYDCGRIDGYFSQQSVEALKQFERDNGITEDGIYDNEEHLLLVGKTMIYINDKSNDLQYNQLLDIMK